MWLLGYPKVCSCGGGKHKSRNHRKSKLLAMYQRFLHAKKTQVKPPEEKKRLKSTFEIKLQETPKTEVTKKEVSNESFTPKTRSSL